MKKANHINANAKERNYVSFHGEKYSGILIILLIIGISGFASKVNAQIVSHPISEISPTAKHYSYTYMLSSTQKKELEYIIVMASNGDIKTVFNACDVCYQYHKGYSQNGTELRCNNCGNRFQIDALGNKGTGGTCNPGYLPHTIQGDNVVINISDLITGAYFFLTQIVSGVDNDIMKPAVILMMERRENLIVTLPSEGHRTFHVLTINGQYRKTISNSSNVVQINISDLPSGAYLLAIEEAGKLTSKLFLVY